MSGIAARRFRMERRGKLERRLRTAGAATAAATWWRAIPCACDAHNNFVDARGKMVALLGVKDLIVVDTPDALLVATRDRAQQVGDIVKALERSKREDLL